MASQQLVGGAHGWAVIRHCQIDVRTVSPNRRAALINWLVVQKGVAVTNDHTDEDVEQLWNKHKRDAVVSRVTINPSPSSLVAS